MVIGIIPDAFNFSLKSPLSAFAENNCPEVGRKCCRPNGENAPYSQRVRHFSLQEAEIGPSSCTSCAGRASRPGSLRGGVGAAPDGESAQSALGGPGPDTNLRPDRPCQSRSRAGNCGPGGTGAPTHAGDLCQDEGGLRGGLSRGGHRGSRLCSSRSPPTWTIRPRASAKFARCSRPRSSTRASRYTS